MEFSKQTINLLNAIKNLPPDIAPQDRLNIGVHQDSENGREYIVIWLNEDKKQVIV